MSDVRSARHELTRNELVKPARVSSVGGEHEYVFWHALVRDVAYGQIPRAERVDRHVAAARWIETVTGARAADDAEILAHHYLTARGYRDVRSGDAAKRGDRSPPDRQRDDDGRSTRRPPDGSPTCACDLLEETSGRRLH